MHTLIELPGFSDISVNVAETMLGSNARHTWFLPLMNTLHGFQMIANSVICCTYLLFPQLNYLSKAYGLWLKTRYKLEITIFMIFHEKTIKMKRSSCSAGRCVEIDEVS